MKTRRMNVTAVSLLFVLSLSACGGGGGGGGMGSIDPGAEPDAVMEAILIKVGDRSASLRDGAPPAPTDTGNDPELRAAADQVGVPSGGSASLSLDFETGSALSAIFAKVVGSNRYAEVLLASEAQSRSGTKALENVVLDIAVPSNIGAGQFCVEISGRDADDLVSNVDTVCFDVDNAVIDALQGTWDFACDGDSDEGDSFEGSWTFNGTDVTVRESQWANDACLGDPEDSYTEQLIVTLGAQVLAADGEPATEIDIRNLTENELVYLMIRVEEDRFQLAFAPENAGGTPETRRNSFDAPGSTFTRAPESVGSAAACFNPVLWQDGTEYTISSRETEGGAFVGEFTSDFTVFTDSSFEGRPATRVFVEDTGTGVADANEYFQIDFARPSVNAIADENLQGSDDSFVSDPGDLLRFDLDPGDAYTFSSVFTEGGGEPDPFTATVTYVGRETIAVPAGTFETCRFDLASDDGYALTEWYGVGNGIEIAEESADPGEPLTREVLLFAEINGEPIGQAPGGGFSSLTPGTYAAGIDGDEQATTFALNEGGTGTWSFGEEGGAITWEVTEDGVLVIAFSGGGTERYTLTSGDTSAGTVLIEFSNEPDDATGTWTRL
ncbi:hypothetical protein [Algiphilus aromaticivorans]|uniref:hypothetical protein n=1 Tax=Algiphilus aromaticivorans TaxID=382454 RepID=UPI0012EBC51F|nr:hypothetical protein [Algiphilus aromaticivorans]